MSRTQSASEVVTAFVLQYVEAHPGCLAINIAAALPADIQDQNLGRYNGVAWAIRRLRRAGRLQDDLPKCSECHRILNRSPRKLYLTKETS